MMALAASRAAANQVSTPPDCSTGGPVGGKLPAQGARTRAKMDGQPAESASAGVHTEQTVLPCWESGVGCGFGEPVALLHSHTAPARC